MKRVTIETVLDVYDSFEDLRPEVQELMQEAIKARKNAYSPYSKFSVGAAIKLSNDEIVAANNQENASYPSGLCAERTAIYYAGAKYPDIPITMIALTAGSLVNNTITPVPPCGACRQAIAEYEVKQNTPIQIFFMGETGKVVGSDSLKNLLPLIFESSFL